MKDTTRESLEYLERTARAILDGTHPKPIRAAYLMRVHATKIEMRAHELGPDDPQ